MATAGGGICGAASLVIHEVWVSGAYLVTLTGWVCCSVFIVIASLFCYYSHSEASVGATVTPVLTILTA